MKKVRGKIINNYLYCGKCGLSSITTDENGRIKLSGVFKETEEGFGLAFFDTKAVYSKELNRELTELSVLCTKCNTVNTYLVDISNNNKRYEELGDIEIIEDGDLC